VRKLFFIWILLLALPEVKSQYFLKDYPKSGTQWIYGVAEKDGYFYTAGANYSGYISFDLLKFDSDGDTIYWKRFKDTSIEMGPASTSVIPTDSTTLLVPAYKYEAGEYHQYLFISNTDGDSIATTSPLGGMEGGVTWGIQNEKVVAFTGAELDTGTGKNKLLILITNNLGQTLIHKTWQYGGFNTEGSEIDTTLDNGYIISSSYTNGTLTFPMAVKFDSLGNYQWHKLLAYNSLHGGGVTVKTLSDGSFLFTGGIDLDNSSFGYNFQRYVAKLNSNGSIRWEKDFGMVESGINYVEIFGGSVQLPNGNLIVLAAQKDTADAFLDKVWLSSMDTAGNIGWNRCYNTCEYILMFSNLLLANDNQSIYVVGYSNCVATGEDLFILKVDTNGCLIPGCSVGVQENDSEIYPFTVFPNPSNGQFSIDLSNKSFEGTIMVENTLGETALQKEVNFQNTATFNISNAPKGIYIISLRSKTQLLNSKVILE